MSDEIKIQHDPKVPQGAETPLPSDAERKSTHGGVFDQNTMSFCRGENVQGRAASLCNPNNADGAASRPFANVSGLACDSPVAPNVRPVDSRTVEGSYPGDHRAKAAPAVMPSNPAPRSAVGQANLSSRTPAAPAAASFPGNVADSDSGN